MMSRLRAWLSSFNPYQPETLQARDGINPVEFEESRTKRRFSRYLVVVFFIFMAWALLAPIDSGVHVMGTVVVQGNRKAVQHPQGGVVQEILVREGSVVKEGDTLLRINPLSLQAELNQTELDYVSALAVESRLLAERSGLRAITWLEELGAYKNVAKADEVKTLQERIFKSRQEDLSSKQRILQEQVSGFQSQIGELDQLMKIRRAQLALIDQEVANNNALADEGYVPRSKANEAQRSRNDVLANMSVTVSDLGKARTALGAARLQVAQERSTFLKDVDALLSETQKGRKGLSLKVESMRFNLSLADLKASVSGTVVGLKVFTVGGVIGAGNTLMEIVPKEQSLIVEARVPTNLIDKVHLGLPSDLRFTAFNQVSTPVVPGKVLLVGADRLLKGPQDDPAGPPEYYVAQIQTTRQGIEMLGSNFVQAGMPVDVIIKTGERTFMSYLLKPIIDRFAVSFKE